MNVDLKTQVLEALRALVGKKLSILRNAGNMKVFHFGAVERIADGLVGEFALHVQCPWRIDGVAGLVTGSQDYYSPPRGNIDDCWEPGSAAGNLQNDIIHSLVGGYDEQTRSYINETERYIVSEVAADRFGGAEVVLSDNCRIVIFPAGSQDEHWRLLRPGSEVPQFVVEKNICYTV